MTNIPDGYGFVAGRSRDNAKAILAAAEKAGVDVNLVATVADGYIAPEAAVLAYEGKTAKEKAPSEEPAEKPEGTPDGTWKNAEIEDWAADNGVDLGGATKKADMLSAISAATKEE